MEDDCFLRSTVSRYDRHVRIPEQRCLSSVKYKMTGTTCGGIARTPPCSRPPWILPCEVSPSAFLETKKKPHLYRNIGENFTGTQGAETSKMPTLCVRAAACPCGARRGSAPSCIDAQLWSLINGKTPLLKLLLPIPVSRSRALYSSIYAKIHP